MENLGRIAYEAYFSYTGGVSIITTDRLPKWDKLPGAVKGAWAAAANAVKEQLERKGGNDE